MGFCHNAEVLEIAQKPGAILLGVMNALAVYDFTRSLKSPLHYTWFHRNDCQNCHHPLTGLLLMLPGWSLILLVPLLKIKLFLIHFKKCCSTNFRISCPCQRVLVARFVRLWGPPHAVAYQAPLSRQHSQADHAGVDSHSFSGEIFLTQVMNLGALTVQTVLCSQAARKAHLPGRLSVKSSLNS